MEVIVDLPEKRDSELVKRIPLSIQASANAWYWVLEDKGEFTVKSCYRALQGECADEYSRMWKRIWTLKLPSKVINLIWRLCKDCQPTNTTLVMRYVNIEVACLWCHCETETCIHVMFLCGFAKTMWRTMGLDKLVHCESYVTPKLIFERMFKQGTKKQCVEVIMLCWSLWPRNMQVWDRSIGSIFGVKSSNSFLLQAWTEAQTREESRRIRGETGDHVWSPPSSGRMKINVHAAILMTRGIGVGAV